MTPQEFIEKWGPGGPAFGLNERAGAQPHFMDLCEVLGVPTPGDANNYCFERGVTKTGTGQGFADVWLRNHFAWEYKAPGKSLDGALKQLMMYALPLDNPPLLVVSDRLKIEIHTHFTGTPSERHVILLEELTRPDIQERLRWLFKSPDRFKPAKTSKEITEEAARAFAGTADRLRNAGALPEQVSHFLTQCLFCFFAEDVGLLPAQLFQRLVGVQISPEKLRAQLKMLFEFMRDGGLFGVESIPWFNGGLFANINVPAISIDDVKALQIASGLNWSAIDPSIIGTLFERGLDPSKRSQLGAHYTDPATILRIVKPVVEAPLLEEWSRIYDSLSSLLAKRDALREAAKTIVDKAKFARVRTQANEAEREAQRNFNAYLEKLKEFKVLDPACGSGNFLYLALKTLKDIEHKVNLEAETLGLQRQHDVTGPHNVLGMEINEYAAELARVTVWIGELQWRIQHGYAFKVDPVLDSLDCIAQQDALIDENGDEANWPAATVVVGNPPFLGTKKMFREMGVEYTERLRRAYAGRVPGFADLVCYWFEKARAKVVAGELGAAGLVATDSIRGGANRQVLDKIVKTATVYNAWSSVKWINEGAAVRVSLIAFASKAFAAHPQLDGAAVSRINADLTCGEDLTAAEKLPENLNAGFVATVKAGAFDISGDVARSWLQMPNPNGKSNADVVKPWSNGMDVIRRNSDTWVVDFGVDMSESDASMYEAPFKHVLAHVKPLRDLNKRASYRNYWWLMAEPIPKMRKALANLHRFIVTPVLAKHRVFTWMHASVLPDHQLIVIARADDTMLGLVHSRFHLLWALRLGTSLEDRPRYTPTTTFETFPFPDGLTPADTASQLTLKLADGTLVRKRAARAL